MLPLCQAAFNRYPFIAGSAQDVPLDDFTHLLGPGGLIDQFFDQYLKPLRRYHADARGAGRPATTPSSACRPPARQFQRAAEIRDALFPAGQQISVKFQLVPAELDARLAQVSIEIGGQRLAYAHGPIEPMAMQWPGTDGIDAGAGDADARQRRCRRR